MTAKTPKIGLALGSGGARGWSHVGALLELNRLGLRPCCVAGTSIGSIAGALYASGRIEIAEEMARGLNWAETAKLFMELNFQRSGLLTGRNFIRLLKDIIPARTFADLALPLATVATVLEDESEIVFREGDLFDAIRASIGIPGMFTPLPFKNRSLVDGGLKNPLPVSVCRAMGAQSVIAIDVNLGGSAANRQKRLKPKSGAGAKGEQGDTELTRLIKSASALAPKLQTPFSESFARWFELQKKPQEPSLSIFDVLTRSFRLIENEITRNTLRLDPPEILIQPAVGGIMTLEFHRGPEAIEAGREAVREKRDELEALFSRY
jgi:NTE family protein